MTEELANEITVLKGKIDGYETEYNNLPPNHTRKDILLNTINTARGILGRLLDQQNAQQGRCSLN